MCVSHEICQISMTPFFWVISVNTNSRVFHWIDLCMIYAVLQFNQMIMAFKLLICAIVAKSHTMLSVFLERQ